MTDGDALFEAIIAAPDDDTLRLVYADWLEENGQPDRATFVRAQVWAAQAEPFSPDARKHDAAAKRLLDWARRRAWGRRVHPWVLELEFRRGFVDHAAVNVATFPENAHALFAAEPIRSLQMTRTDADAQSVSLQPFFDTPQLHHVTRLDLVKLPFAPVELEPLADSPHLANLTDLGLRDTRLMPDWLAQLLVGPALPALAGLDLADLSHHHQRLAEVLPRVEHRRFARLDISRIGFESLEIQRVLHSRCLRDVEELRIGWMTGAGRAGALTHLDLSYGIIPWNRLRVLDLNGQGVGDEGVGQLMQELARRREPVPLRWLGLANNRVGADGVRALVRSDGSKLKLYHLDATGNGLNLSQRAALQTRFPEARIES